MDSGRVDSQRRPSPQRVCKLFGAGLCCDTPRGTSHGAWLVALASASVHRCPRDLGVCSGIEVSLWSAAAARRPLPITTPQFLPPVAVAALALATLSLRMLRFTTPLPPPQLAISEVLLQSSLALRSRTSSQFCSLQGPVLGFLGGDLTVVDDIFLAGIGPFFKTLPLQLLCCERCRFGWEAGARRCGQCGGEMLLSMLAMPKPTHNWGGEDAYLYMGVIDPDSGKVGTVCHGMSYGCGAGAWGHALHEDDYTAMRTDREKDIASMKHSYRQSWLPPSDK
jgi:hypothetical protein